MRRKVKDVDYEADLLLISGLTGHKPQDIAHWTLFTIDTAGDGYVHSSACCAHHAGTDIPLVFGPRLAALPPCRGRDG